MKMLPLILCGLLLALPSLRAEDKKAEGEKWIQLFNGKDLTGWTPKISGYKVGEDPFRMFRVEDGVLKVSYDDLPEFKGQFGHLFYKDKFSSYKIRAEYRFTGEQTKGGPGWAFRNNGIMLHCQAADDMAKDQNFPICIEAQLLGGDGKKNRPCGSVFTPGSHIYHNGKKVEGSVKSKGKTFHGDQWVTFEVEVHAEGDIIHRVNGEEVMRYNKPTIDYNNELMKEGYISIQGETHPTEFRKIEILPLDK